MKSIFCVMFFAMLLVPAYAAETKTECPAMNERREKNIKTEKLKKFQATKSGAVRQ